MLHDLLGAHSAPAERDVTKKLFQRVAPTVLKDWVDAFSGMPDPSLEPIAPAPNDLAGWEAKQTAFNTPQEKIGKEYAAAQGVGISEVEIGTIKALELSPNECKDDNKLVVYAHGGAYTLLSARSSLLGASLIASSLGLRVLSIDYTPAPQARWRGVTDEVLSVFRELAESRGGLSSSSVIVGRVMSPSGPPDIGLSGYRTPVRAAGQAV